MRNTSCRTRTEIIAAICGLAVLSTHGVSGSALPPDPDNVAPRVLQSLSALIRAPDTLGPCRSTSSYRAMALLTRRSDSIFGPGMPQDRTD